MPLEPEVTKVTIEEADEDEPVGITCVCPVEAGVAELGVGRRFVVAAALRETLPAEMGVLAALGLMLRLLCGGGRRPTQRRATRRRVGDSCPELEWS